ncbi:unnamed protein product [Vitrella brassicaformis CCMP3155]|uniref:Methyltransferase domain-containing protein n=1 Tax=Vitrella brassicaformis (strain CCMP3155) TaxID=1169540 RepID=A0A0G4H8A9_VITBC|nr:unnamed protein product [Vitrella brassicaformis CCMP3155]|eukprot:CEM40090.1 unnamed protein product [Vitrella brassicaformis CCMP3155]
MAECPDNPSWPFYAAKVLLRDDKRSAKAVTYLRRAVELDPTNECASYWLAFSSGEADGVDKAPSSYVQKLFDGYAHSFESHLVGKLHYQTPQLVCQVLRENGPLLSPPEPLDVLDLGCGAGLACRALRSSDMMECLGASRLTLVDVDLSEKMLREADAKGGYDALIHGDIVEVLKRWPDVDICLPAAAVRPPLPPSFHLIVACDVCVYRQPWKPLRVHLSSAARGGAAHLLD